MGLILPQTVTVKMTAPTKSYYNKLGYKTKPIGECLDVDVRDLPPTSTYFVNFICDECGQPFSLMQQSYSKNQKKYSNGKTYCRHCVNSGERSGTWNSSISQEEREHKRNYPEYVAFIKRVLSRDNYTCQKCGKRGVKMEVHHMDGYNWNISGRTDDTNGVTLCVDCHKTFHSLYGISNNTKKQFEEWMDQEIRYDKYTGEIYTLPQIYCIDDGKIYKDRFEAAEAIGCSPISVHQTCKGLTKTLFGKRYVFYHDYIKNTLPIYRITNSKEQNSYQKRTKRRKKSDQIALCVTDGKIYDFSKNIELPYNIRYKGDLFRVCNNVNGKKHCGRMIFQKKVIFLSWYWLSDFLKLSLEEQMDIAFKNIKTLQEGSFLYDFLKEYNLILLARPID